jgi:uncharacterized membrane protein YdjX (TVP38/TMEM64 family)
MGAIRAAAMLASIGLAIAAALWLLPDASGMMNELADHPVRFTALATLLCTLALPRQAIAYAAGFAYGPVIGTGLAMIAQTLSCIAKFAWARLFARQWVARRLRGRLAQLDSYLAANSFTATLILRLLPVGNNAALNLLAGASSTRATPFILASTLGFLPQTIIFALLGHGTQLGTTTHLALATALLAGSVGLGWALARKARALPWTRQRA